MKTNYEIQVKIDGRMVTISSENPTTLNQVLTHLACCCATSGRFNQGEGYEHTAKGDYEDAKNLLKAASEVNEILKG